MLNLITPNWPAPDNISAFTTTRLDGYSQPPYDSFNLAMHVGDDTATVARNRMLLKEQLQLANEPKWLNQIHGIQVIQADTAQINATADASFTRQPQIACAILTGDCLPLLICDRAGSIVAAVHAGWKGLAAGIIEATLTALSVPTKDLLVWLGPAIGPEAFEVGEEVYQQFIAFDPQALFAFKRNANNRWLADLYTLAKQRLNAQGVTQIFGGNLCTYTDEQRFYSYRKKNPTGRMASLIWLNNP